MNGIGEFTSIFFYEKEYYCGIAHKNKNCLEISTKLKLLAITKKYIHIKMSKYFRFRKKEDGSVQTGGVYYH